MVVLGAGEEDQSSYDLDRLKKPVEVDSPTVSLPSTVDTTMPRFNSYVSDVTTSLTSLPVSAARTAMVSQRASVCLSVCLSVIVTVFSSGP